MCGGVHWNVRADFCGRRRDYHNAGLLAVALGWPNDWRRIGLLGLRKVFNQGGACLIFSFEFLVN